MTTLVLISYGEVLTTLIYRNHQIRMRTERHTRRESSVVTSKVTIVSIKTGLMETKGSIIISEKLTEIRLDACRSSGIPILI